MTIHTLPAPKCIECGRQCAYRVTNGDNPNGNAGRPYYKCRYCGEFNGFVDDRGISPGNPRCDCGIPSRRQAAGEHKQVPRGLHYVCGSLDGRKCVFYERMMGNDGHQLSVPRGQMNDLTSRSFI